MASWNHPQERFEVVSQAAPRLRTQQLHEQQCAEWGRAIKCHAVGLGWPGCIAQCIAQAPKLKSPDKRAGGALGGPGEPGVNFTGKQANLGAHAP
eukprot:183975-Pelagomonas_calceolata.AAC.8